MAAAASFPNNWEVSDASDNMSGERRIYFQARSIDSEDGPVFNVSCPTEQNGMPTFWLNIQVKPSVQNAVASFNPDIHLIPNPNLQQLIAESSFAWRVSDYSLFPLDARSIDRHLMKYADGGEMVLGLSLSDKDQFFRMSFRGYSKVREYLSSNCKFKL